MNWENVAFLFLGYFLALWHYRKEIQHYGRTMKELRKLADLQAAYRPSGGILQGILGSGAALCEEAKPKGGES